MIPFEVTILGRNSATPTTFANPTSQVVKIYERYFLVDCGEGTQIQLRKNKIPFSKINNIFISHLHGDHYFGLIGLLSSFHLLDRKKDLHIHAPKDLKELIDLQLKVSKTWLKYSIIFHPLESKSPELLYEDDRLTVHSIPLKHSIYTNGFLFKEKPRERKMRVDKLKEYRIEVCDIQNIKDGKDYTTVDGRVIPNEELTEDPPPLRSYAFCSDTGYNPDMIPQIEGVDLLYHEATFLDELVDLADKRGHSTTKQAATIALKANVKKLLIGHFSSRYRYLSPLLDETKSIFENADIADEGVTYSIDYATNS